MKTSAEIILFPSSSVNCEVDILGISLLERTAGFLAGHIGKKTVYAPFLEEKMSFRDIEIINAFPEPGTEVILADPAFIFDKRLLDNLTENFAPTVIACDTDSLNFLGLACISAVDYNEALRADPWSEVKKITETRLDTRIAVINGTYFKILSLHDVSAAEDYLLNSIRKNDDGIISRSLNRVFSLWLTKNTAAMNILPNTWTLIAMLTGLIGCAVILADNYYFGLIGVLLMQISSIIAGVDGEIARLKYLKTTTGKWLNLFSNDIVVLSFLTAITFSGRGDFLILNSGKFLMYLFMAYMLAKYIHVLFYNPEIANVEIFPFNTSKIKKHNGPILVLILSFVKRDFIIFFAFILSIAGYLNLFAPSYLLTIILMFAIIAGKAVRKTFLEKRGA